MMKYPIQIKHVIQDQDVGLGSQIFAYRIAGTMLISLLSALLINQIPSKLIQTIIFNSLWAFILASIPKLCNYDPLDLNSIVNSNPDCNLKSSKANLHPNLFIVGISTLFMGFIHGRRSVDWERRMRWYLLFPFVLVTPLLLWPGGVEDVIEDLKRAVEWTWRIMGL